MTLRLLLGSNNEKKREELARILAGLPLEILRPGDLGHFPAPAEEGTSFLENAVIKARHFARLTDVTTLADDSGLVVDALDGRPGVRSSRFAGEGASDLENCRKLLAMLAAVPDPRPAARFVCAVAVVRGEEILGTAEGRCEGHLLRETRGTGGFGYDPLFFYPPEGKTFAELPPERKEQVSHRGRALRAIRPLLQTLVEGAAEGKG